MAAEPDHAVYAPRIVSALTHCFDGQRAARRIDLVIFDPGKGDGTG